MKNRIYRFRDDLLLLSLLTCLRHLTVGIQYDQCHQDVELSRGMPRQHINQRTVNLWHAIHGWVWRGGREVAHWKKSSSFPIYMAVVTHECTYVCKLKHALPDLLPLCWRFSALLRAPSHAQAGHPDSERQPEPYVHRKRLSRGGCARSRVQAQQCARPRGGKGNTELAS